MTEKNTVIHGDCLEVLKTFPDNFIDAIITDPPYELGFMNKSWDSTGIANSVELWKEVLRVLKPGGHLLSFSGTRTYHRMASAIEDAGFEVRDMIEWVYGSGFPKSLDIGKAVDKELGNKREWVGRNPAWRSGNGKEATTSTGWAKPQRPDKTKGTSEWEGWGTALKPAHEPICMARKPLSEKTVAENCLKWGTGGINIDGCRVGTETIIVKGGSKSGNGFTFCANYNEVNQEHLGRFPANLIHDNSEEVRECFPESKSVKGKNVQRKELPNIAMSGKNYARFNESEGYDDSGNASRFFKSIIYQAKASKSERNGGNANDYNNHPTVKPTTLMEYLINMVSRENQIILDPFRGSGTTALACMNLNRNYILIEKEKKYIDIINNRIKKRKDELKYQELDMFAEVN